MTTITVPTIALEKLQSEIGAGNRARGFREQSDRLIHRDKQWSDAAAATPGDEFFRSEAQFAAEALQNYVVVKAALVITESAELIEETRNGHKPTETYYPTAEGVTRSANDGIVFKPEGVPSELADIVIRSLDFADEFGIDLGAIIEERLAYNATRGIRHGGKAF